MKWRCANNHILGYCKGEPDWETPPQDKIVLKNVPEDTTPDKVGGKCKRNWKECDQFRYLSELIDLSKLPPPKLVETIKPPEPKNKKLKEKKDKPQQIGMFDG